MKLRTWVLAAAFLCVSPLADACDIVVSPKIAFNPEIYLFEGRITGFVTDSLRPSYLAWWEPERVPPGQNGNAAGLLIEPLTVEFVPESAAAYSVFPVGLGAACEPVFYMLSDLETRYQPGDTLAVIAFANDLLEGVPAGTVPLLVRGHTGAIFDVANVGGSQRMPTWGTDPYGGEAFEWVQRHTEAAKQRADRGDWASYHAWTARLQYEYERDLARLALGPSEERIPLLRKIRRYWFSEWAAGLLHNHENFDCPFTTLVNNYLPTQEERDELGGWLLTTRLRPFPSPEACSAAARHAAERAAETRRRNAIRNKLERKPAPTARQ